ncbi:MAG: tRNA (adenosine(37)-N6)-dimethylallyltransferase MiaA [Rhodospirillales bacterium]
MTRLSEEHPAADPAAPAAVVIAGPTASGKSALAAAAAAAFGGTVINADALQVYRELDVLTARPGPDLAARAPHRLYGVLPAAQACSAGRWRQLAVAEIATARAAGRLPVIVGGTGLYIRSLLHGIADVPPVPAACRRAARERLAELGAPGFRAEVAALDPAAGARLGPTDTQRLLRAWEVATATGRPLSDWQSGPVAPPPVRALVIVVQPPRPALHAAIEGRFAAMIGRGAVAEVGALMALGLDPSLPAMKAVGVRELAAHLAGAATLEQATAAAVQSTRQYAKRQTTWFRHQIVPDRVIAAQYSERLEPEIFSLISSFLLTPAS